ncbi:hypothetical protein J3R30DRAFT_3400308 [Lentinula aciculospora]|uniref:Uncharacterized protein n=1 Tax=Lentinula aciculospora TaxID=153920 RepID=A0A9W9ASP2_9AGAR|nr:hypothetical protein J3R30DRAFT_3400308 [Lentinula aciculospora]
MKFQLFPVTLALILFTSLTSLKSCDAAPVSDSQSSIRHDIPPVTKQPPSVPSTNLCFFDFPSQLAQKYQIRAPFKLPVRRFDVSASYRKHIWQGATRPGRDQRLWESEFKNKFLCWNTEEAARKAVISQGSNWRCSLYTDNLRRFQHVRIIHIQLEQILIYTIDA